MCCLGDLIPLGSVGLAVSQTMMLTLLLQLTIRYAADFFGHMTSLERILEYTKLPVEKNMNDKSKYLKYLPFLLLFM